MKAIVEISEDGTFHLPPEILAAIKPNKRFVVEVSQEKLVLHPEDQTQPLPFWATATPEERAERLMQWAQSHKDGPNLPDEALRRENMYD
ncbi:MAG: hypothetical protein HC866_04595 [Leptolyngbyaceae cyanobacterium RU_5_1]|nr:hypothetical protein [Leptolyngbyaceae cyanobacterium RU_5_1]